MLTKRTARRADHLSHFEGGNAASYNHVLDLAWCEAEVLRDALEAIEDIAIAFFCSPHEEQSSSMSPRHQCN